MFHPSFRVVGGAELLAAMQARTLHEAGHEVRVFTFGGASERLAPWLQGLAVESVPKRDLLGALTFWHPTAKLVRRASRAEARIRAFHPDLVLAHNIPAHSMLGRMGLEAKKAWYCHEPPRGLYPLLTNPRIVAEVEAGRAPEGFRRQVEAWRGPRARSWTLEARRAFDREGVAGLPFAIANSPYTRANARAIYGEGLAFEVVPPMVQGPGASGVRSPRRRGVLRVLVNSRLELFKNVETVVRAFDRAAARLGRGSMLHVVGDGSEAGPLQSLAAELPSRDAIRFHGFLGREQLEALRGECDVFALLPLDEPFGMVFPEAALSGLLVIGPDHGGPVDILEGGELGPALPPFDVEGLAEAFLESANQEDAVFDRRQARLRQACEARYSVRAVGDQLRSVVEAYLAG